jgi:hypothetical protein
MSDWWTYRLSDFLMFSAETWHRLFVRLNHDIWPLPLIMLGIGLALVALVLRGDPRSLRIASAVLAGCWLLVAWLFHWERFREIHLAAGWYAGAFLVQSALLLTPFSLSRPPRPSRLRAGVGLVLFGVLLLPLTGPVQGRPLEAVQCFGLAPDPTVTATLGVLAVARARWFVWIIPVLYSVLSGATLLALEAPDAWVPPLAALLAVLFSIFSTRLQTGRET